MRSGNIESAKRCLKSLIDLIVARNLAGLGDRDAIIKRNFGFIGEKAVEIDLGSFYADPALKNPHLYKKELLFESRKLSKWVAKRYPELFPFLLENIKEICSNEQQK